MSTEHPIRAIRRAGVPLAAFETTDPSLTIAGAIGALNDKRDEIRLMQWDICRGLTGINPLGTATVGQIGEPLETQNPTECLNLLAKSKVLADAVIFWHNGHLFIGEPTVKQALWNLRDRFKAAGNVLVILAPALALPPELKNDVVVIAEPLPTIEDIRALILTTTKSAQLPDPAEDVTAKAADALLGLSSFAAEQCLAMSISKAGIDLGSLWERKRKMIEQTPGLSVWRGGETFDDIGGCDNVKDFMRRVSTGKRAPRAIAFIDEIEKSISGAAGDLSGVSQDYLGALLTFMQDKAAAGVIFIGPPGAAKSAVAKATGNNAGIPTIQLDLGAMKGSLVGQSEQQLRQALNVIDAVSQGRTLFIATCNSFGNLPPELKRRFTLGTFFFDLPTAGERETIWDIYAKKFQMYGPGEQRTPQDDGWTGAEIKQCCDIADRLGISLAEAARFIVPVARSAAETIEGLRKQASGKFISASGYGVYQYAEETQAPKGRKILAE